MIIKKISEIEPYEGFTKAETALLKENNIDMENFKKLFPDYKQETENLNLVIKKLSKLKMENEFTNYITKNAGKKFCVIGDYDVDGVLATTIMILGLRAAGINCSYIIPNRLTDSYGISEAHIERAISEGAQVLITVDNGIGCKDAVKYAKEKGLDVVITDHHIPIESELPEDVLIIDPKYNNDKFVDICGANVAFKLMNALLEKMNLAKDNFYLIIELAIFAAIATITDMMPEIGENRIFVKSMLKYVNMLKEKNIWSGRILKMLKGLGGSFIIYNENFLIDEDTFSFFVGPTMNALGRVEGNVERLVKDILNVADDQTINLNKYLQINRNRKEYTKQLVENHVPNKDIINFEIIDQNKYKFPINGLIGLVANKILSTENKVSLAGFIKDGYYEFSCRSHDGYSIHDGFERIKEAHPELELSGGGHEAAMGLRLPAKDNCLAEFKKYLTEDYLQNSKEQESVIYDYEPELAEEIIQAYSNFGVFGPGFKRLKFRTVGKLRNFTDNNIRIGKMNLEYHVPQSLYYAPVDAMSTAIFDIKFYRNGPYYRVSELTVEGFEDVS